MMLYAAFYAAASAALATLNPPVPLWAFEEAPAEPGGAYATYQAIGPGGTRRTFDHAADYAVMQINVSALKSDPARHTTLSQAFAALDTVKTFQRRGPPLPLSDPASDPYKTLRADYEVSE